MKRYRLETFSNSQNQMLSFTIIAPDDDVAIERAIKACNVGRRELLGVFPEDGCKFSEYSIY